MTSRPDAAGRSEIDESAFVAFLGSIVVKDTFRKVDRGRYIDTGSYSNSAQLIRRYRLATPVLRADFSQWRDATYPQPGWDLKSEIDAHHRLYGRTVGSRPHRLAFTIISGRVDKPLVPEYEITYSVF